MSSAAQRKKSCPSCCQRGESLSWRRRRTGWTMLQPATVWRGGGRRQSKGMPGGGKEVARVKEWRRHKGSQRVGPGHGGTISRERNLSFGGAQGYCGGLSRRTGKFNSKSGCRCSRSWNAWQCMRRGRTLRVRRRRGRCGKVSCIGRKCYVQRCKKVRPGWQLRWWKSLVEDRGLGKEEAHGVVGALRQHSWQGYRHLPHLRPRWMWLTLRRKEDGKKGNEEQYPDLRGDFAHRVACGKPARRSLTVTWDHGVVLSGDRGEYVSL